MGYYTIPLCISIIFLDCDRFFKNPPSYPLKKTRKFFIASTVATLTLVLISSLLYNRWQHKQIPENLNINPHIEYKKFRGENCPEGYSHVNLSEAADSNNRDKLSKILAPWDIARLANGASMDGSGYGSKLRSDDNRQLGHSLCQR